MKGLVGIFLPLCIFSFIAFGISVAVLGTENLAESEGLAVSDITTLSDDYSDIEINSNGVNVSVYPSPNGRTMICTDENHKNSVYYSTDDDTLRLSLTRKVEGLEDLLSWMDDSDFTVEVYVPEKVYDSIAATVNAGRTEINGLNIEVADLELNAGELIYAAAEGSVTNGLDVKVSAGNCEIYNAAAETYTLEINAGNLTTYGLTGDGSITVNAGNGEFNFDELGDETDLNVNAGNIDVNLPEGVSATIYCDRNAGDLKVKYNGIRKEMKDGEELELGDGECDINAELTAGNITISDKLKQKTAPPVKTPDYSNNSEAVTSAVQTTVIHPEDISPVESTVADEE